MASGPPTDPNYDKVCVLWDIENEAVPRTLKLDQCTKILTRGVMRENGFTLSNNQRIRIVCGGKQQDCTATACRYQYLSTGGTIVHAGPPRIQSTPVEGVDITCGWRANGLDATADNYIIDHLNKYFQLNQNVTVILFTNDDKLRKRAKDLEIQNVYRGNKVVLHPKDVWDLTLLTD